MKLSSINNFNFFFLAALALIISFGLSFLYFGEKEEGNTLKNESQYRTNKHEIGLIYFGCSYCPSATNEELPKTLKNLSDTLKGIVLDKGYRYTLIGLSNEKDIKNGINHLNNIASFDEVSIGNNMSNTSLQKYVWKNYDGPLSSATPQVIISKRIYSTRLVNGVEFVLPRIKSEEIIFRRSGFQEIKILLSSHNFYNKMSSLQQIES